jgi:hypothetical protein
MEEFAAMPREEVVRFELVKGELVPLAAEHCGTDGFETGSPLS